MKELDWQPLPDETTLDLVAALVGEADPDYLRVYDISGRVASLPFYKKFKLIRLSGTHGGENAVVFDLYALWDGEATPTLLDGASSDVHLTNAKEQIQLDEFTAPDYLRFFLFTMHTELGAFILLEHPVGDERVDRYVKPLELVEKNEAGELLYEASVVYDRIAYETTFAVTPNGVVEMVSDEPFSEDKLPLDIPPTSPSFDKGDNLRACLQGSREVITLLNRTAAKRSERPALLLLVELLLEQALRQQRQHRLLDSFNTAIAREDVLARFATLMSSASPVVVVESQLPFVEEVIADIIQIHSKTSQPIKPVTAREHDDGSIGFHLGEKRHQLVLVPLQTYRRVQLLERLAHDIAIHDHPALIACESFSQLPEALRQLVDITLKLNQLDANLFETLFDRVMGEPPPSGWRDGSENNWVRHVLHNDFEHPRRMGLSRQKAFTYIRAQVQERLAGVDPAHGLRLDELHGLGEARQHALDLIADIHAALQGKIPWSQVDRGMLLVGPPGTGKTTLALAIARECDVKFIKVSASGWQSAGDSLAPHLRAIRATFAEARRYAPSILFIDEIDGLGNREKFTGSNAQYMTEVVNAVLEQIQGMDPLAPVFIVAATNHEDRVDSALKRAGRLDRVIHIPRPDSDALERIFDHYLKEIAGCRLLGNDIDSQLLGRYSLGLTGADVERVVRGAARRARKKDQALSQSDLFDELTRKPRTWDGHPRMSPQDIERTAQHEAGHALAMYLSTSKGEDIGYVSIVPRDDGSLGFVATLPDERAHLTRRDYEEWLEVLLAGRAAEEIRYGPEQVSGGCANDLEQATNMALRMITRLGLGSRLAWRAEAGDAEWEQSETLLTEAYSRVLGKLRVARDQMDRLTVEIIARQDLNGDEVRQILERHRDTRNAKMLKKPKPAVKKTGTKSTP